MGIEAAVELLQATFYTALVMVAPLLFTAMAVGLLISVVQAATSLQEQTLSFVPKLLAVVGVMLFTAYWTIEKILAFTQAMFDRVAAGGF
ncbi:flagellar type III secretion system protein FliQ [Ruficoccus amylovorans]|uniref:Flagellar type III secretion system protein FliQ n=1 Tax=Ruficoccus amylovorans TaxID=1804625 RepID=A0A842HFM9_9BACT|nr:flagellar biosynthetic protein FliQ [Ruficoccus amylovorans]MBC2595020.1 flagellar type III secretion system protein FliQ [Ruficoccus amylovorans]